MERTFFAEGSFFANHYSKLEDCNETNLNLILNRLEDNG